MKICIISEYDVSMKNKTKYLMYFYHSLETIIKIIPYREKINLNNCYSISEVAIVRNEQKGIFS